LREAGLLVHILVVPDGKDPDEFIRSHGENGHARFQQLLDSCGNDVEYQLAKLKSSISLQTPEGKIRYLHAAAEVLAGLENDLERDVYAGKLAEEANVQRGSVIQQVNSIRKKKGHFQKKMEFRNFRRQVTGAQSKVNPEKQQNLRAARAEEILLGAMIDYPENSAYIIANLDPKMFITAFNRRVYAKIVGKMKDDKVGNLTDLSGSLTAEEMGVIAGYCARHSGKPTGKQEIDSCIRILVEENEKQNLRASSAEEIQHDYLPKLREIKK
jgi:DNA primase